MTVIKKTKNCKCVEDGQEDKSVLLCWWECKLVHRYGEQYEESSKHKKRNNHVI
jgi:hypothetical protein